MFLPINRNNRTPQHISLHQALHTISAPLNHPHPTPSTPHQSFSLPGNICNTILHAAKNKGAGINADSIDLFKELIKQPIPSIKPDLHYIFDLIYQNKLPHPIKRYFTDVYLFCLHKDPTDTTKLCPLGIPTAIRCLIASRVAHTLRDKFASHLLPYNYAVGIPNGSDFIVKAMQLSIEKFIQTPQQTNICQHIKDKNTSLLQRIIYTAPPSHGQPHPSHLNLCNNRRILHPPTSHRQIRPAHPSRTHHRIPAPWPTCRLRLLRHYLLLLLHYERKREYIIPYHLHH